MKVAIARMSEVAAHGRMDAPFHIALAETRAMVAALRERHEDSQAIALVVAAAADRNAVQPLSVLLRNKDRRVDDATARRLAEDYPHLALALIQREIRESVEHLREEIARNELAMDALVAIADA